MDRNRVKEGCERGETVFGTYLTLPAAVEVDIAALAGFDFIRIDAYHAPYDRQMLAEMIRAAYGHDVTPWVRVRNDPWEIMLALDMGAQIITVPDVGTADAARSAVSAAFYPPRGTREMSRPPRLRNLSGREYLDWAGENVQVSCQIEGAEGIERYREIIAVDGVDIIQSGRGDISLALGVPAETLHPDVLAVEHKILRAALDAGKQANVMVPLTPEGLELAAAWIAEGVRIVTLDSDYRILTRAYKDALAAVRSMTG